MQEIVDGVSVDVSQVYVKQRTSHTPQQSRQQALQYAIINSTFQALTLRLDFSRSKNIQLYRCLTDDQDALGAGTIDVLVAPLQRRIAVYVVQSSSELAYVQVAFSIIQTASPSSDEMEPARSKVDAAVANSIALSSQVFGYAEATTFYPVDKFCSGVNRVHRKNGAQYIDPQFPPSLSSLTSNETKNQWRIATWSHLGDVVDASWSFIGVTAVDTPLRPIWIHEGLPCHESWVCAMDTLHTDRLYWCSRWFGRRLTKKLHHSWDRIRDMSSIVISLCVDCIDWEQTVVDLYVPVIVTPDSSGALGSLSAWLQCGEFYCALLEKAYAKRCGSYARMGTISARTMLQELTGAPTVDLYRSRQGECSHDEMLAALARVLHPHAKRANPVMVSFCLVDEHHCAFQVLSVHSSTVILRDPVDVIKPATQAQLQAMLDVADDGTIALPLSVFAALQPVVFELRLDHNHHWRRRKILMKKNEDGQKAQFQVAVSCRSLQSVVIRGIVRANGARGPGVGLTIDRIDECGRWHRLDLEAQAQEATRTQHSQRELAECQVMWVAGPGEYVITLSMEDEQSVDCTVEAQTKHAVLDTLTLLFKSLDQDMDGVLDANELLRFLQVHEQLPASSTADLAANVSSFIDQYSNADASSTSTPGLRMADLLAVYQAIAVAETNSPATQLEHVIISMIQHDLLEVLGDTAHDPDTTRISLIETVELVCSIHSDQEDVVIQVL